MKSQRYRLKNAKVRGKNVVTWRKNDDFFKKYGSELPEGREAWGSDLNFIKFSRKKCAIGICGVVFDAFVAVLAVYCLFFCACSWILTEFC